jgi:hypothetical protein
LPNADEPQPIRKKLIRRASPKPPSVAEKFFSANLGVFGDSRRKNFSLFSKISLITDYSTFSVDPKIKFSSLQKSPGSATNYISARHRRSFAGIHGFPAAGKMFLHIRDFFITFQARPFEAAALASS